MVALRPGSPRQLRDKVLACLRERGIGCRNYFTPIHLQPFYQERFGLKEGMFPVTESVAARTIALPFHNRLTEAEVETVARGIKEAFSGR